MPDHQKRYRHEENMYPMHYTLYAKDKIQTLSKSDQEDMKHYKELLISKIPDLGNMMCDEILLKLGSFLNGADNGK